MNNHPIWQSLSDVERLLKNKEANTQRFKEAISESNAPKLDLQKIKEISAFFENIYKSHKNA